MGVPGNQTILPYYSFSDTPSVSLPPPTLVKGPTPETFRRVPKSPPVKTDLVVHIPHSVPASLPRSVVTSGGDTTYTEIYSSSVNV